METIFFITYYENLFRLIINKYLNINCVIFIYKEINIMSLKRQKKCFERTNQTHVFSMSENIESFSL